MKRQRTIAMVGLLVAAVWSLASGAGCANEDDEASLHVEEFRVAEPLVSSQDPTISDQWETITAVTEPYDDVEASVDEEPPRLASNRRELQLQCVSILKEIAFCSGEDAFLDIIGQAPNLREDGERDRFLELVEVWFEPGGTQRDCQRIIAEEHHRREEAKIMWHQASVASQQVCQPFGDTLLETEALESIGLLWAQAE